MKKKIIIVFAVFFIIIAIPFLINLIFENNETRNILISYSATIVGSLTTFMCLYITFKHEDRNRINDIENQYKPIIKLESIIDEDETFSEIDIIGDSRYYHNKIHDFSKTKLVFINNGRGEMNDIKFSNIRFDTRPDIRIQEVENNITFSGKIECSELSVLDKLSFMFVFPKRINYYKNEIERYFVSFDVSFYGCMYKKKYNYKVSFVLEHYVGITKDNIYNMKVTKIGC